MIRIHVFIAHDFSSQGEKLHPPFSVLSRPLTYATLPVKLSVLEAADGYVTLPAV
jgi:hypothetical protein